ncbi:MAG: hypothetical protein ACJA2W_001906 [Planctomycetota bacterium]
MIRVAARRWTCGLGGPRHISELGNRRMGKHFAWSDRPACSSQAGHHLNPEDRVAAQLQEVIVNAHRFHVQDAAPDLGDRRF